MSKKSDKEKDKKEFSEKNARDEVLAFLPRMGLSTKSLIIYPINCYCEFYFRTFF